MKFYTILFLLSFFVLALPFSSHSQGFLPRVAVINGLRDNKEEASSKDKSGVFCDLLFADLLKNKNIELVEREAIEKVLAEQDIAGAGSSGSFLKAGKVLRADLLIVLLDEGGKSKLYFFDVNHGLRVETCFVDIKGHKKSFSDIKSSLKKALLFINGKGKAIYSVPPFSNNDILYQNDKYQGLLAENLRNELFAKGALLIEFDEALQIAGELSISDGDGEIKSLPLTLISGEFTQNPNDKNSLDLKLSKIQLNDKTAELFSGRINVKSQGELKSTITKIASLLLRNNKTPVALDMKEQLSIILKKAREHMSAEAFEQARIEAATAIMMDTSNVEARMIFCSSIAENLKTNKYRQKDPKYFQKLCTVFLDQLEWLAMNRKAGYRIPYFYIIKAAKERLETDPLLDFLVALQNIAARWMKHDYFLCRLYAQALNEQGFEAGSHCIIYDKDKVERLAAVIIANKVYSQARVMISDCIGNCSEGKEPAYAQFYYILLQQKDMPYSQRKFISTALTRLNENKKKRDGGIFYQVPQIDAPVDNLDNYFQEAGALSETELAGIAGVVETLEGFEDYNGIRLLIESLKKSGKELSYNDFLELMKAYEKILSEISLSNAPIEQKRKLYLKYSAKSVALFQECLDKNMEQRCMPMLNDKRFRELVFGDPKDEECIAAYWKIMDSIRLMYVDVRKRFAQARIDKQLQTKAGQSLIISEFVLCELYFNSFIDCPVEEMVNSLDGAAAPGTPVWTDVMKGALLGLIYTKNHEFLQNLLKYLSQNEKYKEFSKGVFLLLARDFKKQDPKTYDDDIRAILALAPQDDSGEAEIKIDVKELSFSFSRDCESLKKARLRDIIVCGKSGDAMLYDRQILFSKEPGKFEKVIKDNDNVECVSDAAWDGKYLWYAVINNNESERKGCSRGEIICWDPARDKRKRWDSKNGVALEFLNETDTWKKKRDTARLCDPPLGDLAYSTIRLFPCDGKVFVFASFYDPVEYNLSYVEHRVWMGLIEGSGNLKIFYKAKAGKESPFYSGILFVNTPVCVKDNVLKYFGKNVTMFIDMASLTVSFQKYYCRRWMGESGERSRIIDNHVFFDCGLLEMVHGKDELDMWWRLNSHVGKGRHNLFKIGDNLYMHVAGYGLLHMKSQVEKADMVIDYKTFTPAFDDLLASSHYGILGIKDGKFYSVTLP